MACSYLNTLGIKTWRTTIKQHHTLSFLVLKLCFKLESNQKINYYGFNDGLTQKIRTPWKILELISLAPPILSRFSLPRLMGYVVVCDRYIIDTLVTLSFFLKEPSIVSGKLAYLLLKSIPKNSLLIYFEADTATILERKKDEPLTEQLIEYYKNSYRFIVKESGLKIHTIDNSVISVEDVQAELKSIIVSSIA